MCAIDSRHRGMSRLLSAGLLLVPQLVLAAPPDLANLASPDSLLHIGWPGRKHTRVIAADTAMGKTLADPQVRAFCERLFAAVDQMLLTRGIPDEQHGLYNEAKALLLKLFENPTALILYDLKLDEMAPMLDAVLLCETGAATAQMLEHFEQLVQGVGLQPGQAAEDVPAGQFKRLFAPVPGGVFYGQLGDHFVLAAGPNALTLLNDRFTAAAPALASAPALVRARDAIGGGAATRSWSIHVNGKRIRALLEEGIRKYDQAPENALREYRDVMTRIGLVNLDAATWELHHRHGGCVNGLYLQFDGAPQGWITGVSGAPITPDELRWIPRDVRWGAAGRLSWTEPFNELKDTLSFGNDDIAAFLDEFVQGLHEATGVHAGTDILDLIGDTVLKYDAAENAGVLFTGIAAIVKSRDATLLRSNLRKLIVGLAELTSPDVQITAAELQTALGNIDYVDVSGLPVPVAPAWAQHEDWIVLGLYPQVVRNALHRMAKPSEHAKDTLMDNADFNRLREHIQPFGCAVYYGDAKRAAESAYTVILPLLQTGLAMAQAEGFDLDIGTFPTRNALTQHLFGDIATVRGGKDDVLMLLHGPLPIPVPIFGGAEVPLATTALMTSILVPSLTRAREQAQQTGSMANLRNIGMACHSYAQDHQGKFPPNLQTLIDEGLLAEDNLKSPYAVPGTPCYVYISGHADIGPSAHKRVLAHERPLLGNNELIAVLFVDGHVERMPQAAFEAALARTKDALRQGNR